jgi:hypothetical protein
MEQPDRAIIIGAVWSWVVDHDNNLSYSPRRWRASPPTRSRSSGIWPASAKVRFVFDEGHWPLLLGAAEERNMTVARLSRFTLEVISREDLWGAVLDGWATVQRPR